MCSFVAIHSIYLLYDCMAISMWGCVWLHLCVAVHDYIYVCLSMASFIYRCDDYIYVWLGMATSINGCVWLHLCTVHLPVFAAVYDYTSICGNVRLCMTTSMYGCVWLHPCAALYGHIYVSLCMTTSKCSCV